MSAAIDKSLVKTDVSSVKVDKSLVKTDVSSVKVDVSSVKVDKSLPWVEKYRPNQFDDIVLDPLNREFLDRKSVV